MKKIFTCLLLFLCLITSIAQTTINYTESSDDFPNPERGFYRYTETRSGSYTLLNSATLASYRNLNTPPTANYSIYSSLIFRYFFLEDFTASSISQSYLDNMTTDFAAARAAGVKVIPRFAYTDEVDGSGCSNFICPPYGDAPKSRVLEHISQIAPILEANKDVLAVVQMGFIGTWGENYYTDYFGDASMSPFKLVDQNWIDRSDVLQALLDAVPDERQVQVRYPQMKQRFVYGVNAPTNSAALTPAEAHDGSDKSRVAFHNDCFLASSTDFGTYFDYGNSSSGAISDTTNLKPYLADETRYTAMGGETCSDFNPYSDCASSGAGAGGDTELRRLHFSYLNSQYNNDVNNDWVGLCMEDIKKNLGYRFVLSSGTYTDAAAPGQTININLSLDNVGYAAPYNPRGVEFILRNTSTAELWFVQSDADPRTWLRETSPHTINTDFCLPAGIPLGTYDLLLNLPDPEMSIYSRSEYAIRCANTGVWEAATGYNDLGHTLTVSSGAGGTACSGEATFTSISSFLPVELSRFTAESVENGILLEWRTESEENNLGFTLQRSTDARAFSEITFVEGSGTSDTPVSYYITDEEVERGQRYYYRLVQTDRDGTTAYSHVVSAAVPGTEEKSSISGLSIYPNPNGGTFTIEISGGLFDAEISVTDARGRRVFFQKAVAGNIPISGLAPGLYFVSLKAEKGIQTERVVVK